MLQANQDIRLEIRQSGLKHWQVSEKYGLCDGNFSRKLRHELPDSEKQKLRKIIKDLKKEAQPQ